MPLRNRDWGWRMHLLCRFRMPESIRLEAVPAFASS